MIYKSLYHSTLQRITVKIFGLVRALQKGATAQRDAAPVITIQGSQEYQPGTQAPAIRERDPL